MILFKLIINASENRRIFTLNLMLVFGWAHRGSTRGFIKQGHNVRHEPFYLLHHFILFSMLMHRIYKLGNL